MTGEMQFYPIMLRKIWNRDGFLLVLLLSCLFGNISAQQTVYKQKAFFWGINALHTAGNTYHYSKLKSVGHNQFKINFLDKQVKLKLNRTTAHISDATLLSTFATAGIFILAQVPKNNRANNSIRMAENLWMTYNVTETFKNSVKRLRPYAYTKSILIKDDYRSFISGHSSLTSTLATSMWLSKPKNKLLPILASGLAVGTAALRVKAGKHFVSDVLAGALVGFGVAFIHEKIAPVNRP